MREFDATDRMPSTKEIVFDELCRPEFLNRFAPDGVQLRQVPSSAPAEAADEAGPRGPEEVREETLRVLPEGWRLEWSGSTESGEYGGFAEVRDFSAGSSEVTVHVTMSDEAVDRRSDSEVEAALVGTLRDLYLAVSKRVTNP